jgi:parvulin-like peptidyl-prolyl isomerase
MFFFRKYRRFLAVPLAALMMAVSAPLTIAQAALVSTDEIVQTSEADTQRARLSALVMRDDVQQQLRAQGIDPAEAAARVATLSDGEVRQAMARIDSLPAGQGAIESIVGVLVIVFIILLITDLLGLTDVFSFDK